MPKISVSIPQEVLEFVNGQGSNRSKAIVTILREYKEKKQRENLAKAYREYADFCENDDIGWWEEWESSSARDLARES